MKIRTTLLFPALCLLAYPLFTQADVLFFDGFEDDTAGDGNAIEFWTESNNTYVVDSASHTGDQSIFMRSGEASFRDLTQTTAVNITGTEDIEISWWMRQGTNSWEGDSFKFEIDFGNGDNFQTVLTDTGFADGGSFNYSGTPIAMTAGTGTSLTFLEYTVTVNSAFLTSESASSIKLKFSHNTGSSGEDTYIDDISIATVPEPAAVTLLVIGFATLMITRRKNK